MTITLGSRADHHGAAPTKLIHFAEACNPPRCTHQAKRIVKVGNFHRLADTPELRAACSFWDTLLLAHRPAEPLFGPLALAVELTWPWNAGDPKKVRAKGRTWHDTRPDLDNQSKVITDSMGRCGYFVVDSQIVQLALTKWRGDRPGVRVWLWPIAEETPREVEPLLLGLFE